MESLLLLRYGELWLKSPEVRRRFTDRLLSNIGESFRVAGIPAKVISSRDRIFVGVDDRNLGASKRILSHTFGLVSFSQVSKIPAEKAKISESLLHAAKETICPADTFAIRCQRSGTHPFTSNEIERECGAVVVKSLGNKVNLTHPDKTVFIDVRDNEAYIFSEKIPAAGGLPLGVEGRVVAVFGNDFERAAVASYLMMKRGCRVFPVFSRGADPNKAVRFLKKFDPLVKPYVSTSKDTVAFAITLCKKKNALGIILENGLEDFSVSKKPKLFDKKSAMPFLYPLVGYTGRDVDVLYGRIAK